jgi:ketosteroid isomerase-like protein
MYTSSLTWLSTFALHCMLLMPAAVWTQTKESNAKIKGKSPQAQKLFDEIAEADRVLFDAFNKRDLEKLKSLFTHDLEFYHDTNGLVSYQQTIENLKKLFEQNLGLKRELVKGSLEVYPVKDYGAIATGTHVFSHFENGKEDRGTFKFVNIWRKTDGTWKVARVISFDH